MMTFFILLRNLDFGLAVAAAAAAGSGVDSAVAVAEVVVEGKLVEQTDSVIVTVVVVYVNSVSVGSSVVGVGSSVPVV